MEKKKTRVLIGIPTRETCYADTFKSIYGLAVPDDVETGINFAVGYTVVHGRNTVVKQALDGNFDYLFFVDDDIILPQNILLNLLAACENGFDVASGWYCMKDGKGKTVVMNPLLSNKEFRFLKADEVPKNELISTFAIGLGCALIKTDIFRKLQEIEDCGEYWFDWVYEKYNEKAVHVGEDVNFCDRIIKKCDAKLAIDTSMRCGHIGRVVF